MAITFQVNLQTIDVLSSKNPYSSNDPQGVNFPNTRSTWFPDFLRDNYDLKNGNQIVVSGDQALYLLNNFTSSCTINGQAFGSNSSYNFLTYVSGTAVP
jgi:hypothetical protein